MLRHHIANLNRRISEYQQSDGIDSENDGVKGQNDGIKYQNDGIKLLSKTLQRVYSEIAKNPEIRTSDLMEILNISESTVTRATRQLKKLGLIQRSGSPKSGRWLIPH